MGMQWALLQNGSLGIVPGALFALLGTELLLPWQKCWEGVPFNSTPSPQALWDKGMPSFNGLAVWGSVCHRKASQWGRGIFSQFTLLLGGVSLLAPQQAARFPRHCRSSLCLQRYPLLMGFGIYPYKLGSQGGSSLPLTQPPK